MADANTADNVTARSLRGSASFQPLPRNAEVCLLYRRLAVGGPFEESARWKYQPLRTMEGLEPVGDTWVASEAVAARNKPIEAPGF
jgi:hypothetical protein